ncbi:MAG: phosphopantetheine-binding protein [Bacteroidales bacterium]|jgi:acyl carrier protein|nr:phosphopantetheine-binding protein [Bacteroidales bacterium]
MKREEIEAIVKNFLIEEFEVDEKLITHEALLKEDLGIDSLDFIDIVVIVERNLGFKIKPEEMTDVRNFRQFCDYMESKAGNQ